MRVGVGGDGGERWAGSGLASRTRYLTFVLTPTPPKPGFQFTPSHPDTGVLAVVSEGPQGSWEPRSQMPSVSARSAAVTKYHTPGGLNHRHLSHSPGIWEGWDRAAATVGTWRMDGRLLAVSSPGGERASLFLSLQRCQPHPEASALRTLFKPPGLPKVPPPNATTFGMRASTYELGAGHTDYGST